jgi:hypothetical protein
MSIRGGSLLLVGMVALAMAAGNSAAAAPAEAPPHLAVYRQFTDESDTHVERIARKALKNYFLQAASLRQVVGSLRGERREVKDEQAAFDYGLSISHGAARFELRRRLRTGALRFGLDSAGGVDLLFSHARLSTVRLGVGYDRRERRCAIACRLRF